MGALGHLGWMAIKDEVTWGTKVVTSMNFGEIESETIEVKRPGKTIKVVNNSRVMTKHVQLAKVVGGGFVFPVNVEDLIGVLLKHTLPSETLVDNGVGNGGDHTFETSNTIPVGLTASIGRDVDIFEAYGGRVRGLDFASKLDEVLMCTPDLSFKDMDLIGTVQTPSYSTQLPLVYHTGTWTVDGAGTIIISDFSLSIKTGIKDARGQIGSALIQQQLAGIYDITGSITAYFDNTTMINKFLNATSGKLVLSLTGTAVGTSTRKIVFTVPTAIFTGETPKIKDADSEIMLTLPFKALKTGSGSPDKLIQVLLVNSQRTAY